MKKQNKINKNKRIEEAWIIVPITVILIATIIAIVLSARGSPNVFFEFERVSVTAGSPLNTANYIYNVTPINQRITDDFYFVSYIDSLDNVFDYDLTRTPGNFSVNETFQINVSIEYETLPELNKDTTVYFFGAFGDDKMKELYQEKIIPDRLFKKEEPLRAFAVWWDPVNTTYLNAIGIYENFRYEDESKRYFRKLYFWSPEND